MVSSILGQRKPPLGRRAGEPSASASPVSSSQAFQAGSAMPNPRPSKFAALDQQHRCCLCPRWVLEGSRDRRWVCEESSPPRECCLLVRGCSAGAARPPHSPPLALGQQSSCPSPQLFKALSSFAKLPVLLILWFEQMLPAAAVRLRSDPPSPGLYTQEREKAKRYGACGCPSRATHSLQKTGENSR